MKKLQNKVALITGGTSGIGFATAMRFHEEGAKVYVTGKNDKTLAEAKKLLPKEVVILKSDAGDLSEIDQLLENLKKSAVTLDIVFLNAGIAIMKPFEDTSEGDFDSTMNINFKGPFFLLQKVLPMLGKNTSIILTSSVAGHKGMAMMAAYSASKAAVKSLGGTLGAYFAGRGIRVNTISPGAIATPIFGKTGLPKEALDGFGATITQTVPMHRFGEADEIAKAALFLASDESSYLNATDIIVDGGYMSV